MNNVLLLRPHHCLCAILYDPKGHSAPYTEIMYSIVDTLKDNPYQRIELSSHLDKICGYCPHNNMGMCSKGGEVKRSDENCLIFCGLTSNQHISWLELKHSLVNNILDAHKLQQACAGCQYLAQCEQTNRKLLEGTKHIKGAY